MFENMLTNGTLIMEGILLALIVVGITSTFNKESSFDEECISTRCMTAAMSPFMVLMFGIAAINNEAVIAMFGKTLVGSVIGGSAMLLSAILAIVATVKDRNNQVRQYEWLQIYGVLTFIIFSIALVVFVLS